MLLEAGIAVPLPSLLSASTIAVIAAVDLRCCVYRPPAHPSVRLAGVSGFMSATALLHTADF